MIDREIGVAALDKELNEIQDVPENERDSSYWLGLARDNYESSTDYIDSNIRQQWEASIAHQNNEHAPDSKYHSDLYAKRSKTFRPKTRTNNVNAESAFAKAAFSTTDLTSIQAVNDNDQVQQASAEVVQELLQYRLTRSIPWYLTAMGAFQDARVYGICASYQGWEYEESKFDTPMVGPMGEQILDEMGQSIIQEAVDVIKDQPIIDLMPPENIRFEPNADWRDPVNTSPYLIRMVPMYAADIQAKAKQKGWIEYELGTIANADENDNDETRQQREGNRRVDPADQSKAEHKEFTLVWCHENYVRIGGQDYVYWTIGTRLLLSDPEPIEDVYPHLMPGERPVTLGYTVIEAHKNYPSSPTRLIEELQKDVNDIANQRFDNVKLVLNKRYFLRRGTTQTDLQALARNVPGGTIMVENPDKDVRIVDTPDVTGSSYNDQDRLDLAIDELTGVMSQQTVQNNRNLNETVGGMSMMSKAADQAADYGIKTFIETWMEPVIRQLVRLEQYYESDDKILALAAEKAELFQKYGIDRPTDEMLKAELTVNVNIGFGATNPRTQVEQFTFGLQNVAQLPGAIERVDVDEVIKEVFGKLGYRDGGRFFTPPQEPQPPRPDPNTMAQLEVKQQELQLENQRLQLEAQFKQQQEAMHQQRWMIEQDNKMQLEMSKLALQKEMKLNELYEKLGIERLKIQTDRDKTAVDANIKMTTQRLQQQNLEMGRDTF